MDFFPTAYKAILGRIERIDPVVVVDGAGQEERVALFAAGYRRSRIRHRVGQVSWVVLYVFVAIQLAWVLRPFVGSPNIPTRFFREEAWSNAYVVVADLVWRMLS